MKSVALALGLRVVAALLAYGVNQVEYTIGETAIGGMHPRPAASVAGAGEGVRTLDDLLGKKLVGTVVGKRTRKMP